MQKNSFRLRNTELLPKGFLAQLSEHQVEWVKTSLICIHVSVC